MLIVQQMNVGLQVAVLVFVDAVNILAWFPVSMRKEVDHTAYTPSISTRSSSSIPEFQNVCDPSQHLRQGQMNTLIRKHDCVI